MKKFGGEHVISGNIVVRQRGTQFHPGANIGMGTDHTLFATCDGRVEFRAKANGRTYVSVNPIAQAAE
ncbi:large subunit ribosomal protein L27 [Variibacter gotjawalensis]|nr:large subunit ribosomal protein L27 [Variibacter gotjawalensis]